MVRMNLSEAAQLLDAELIGADTVFEGVSTDTRSLSSQQLFIALVGQRSDGHDFLSEAQARGAAGALVSHDIATALPCLRVPSPRQALMQLAQAWRARFDLPLVAVTGSNGKTTVKEMIAHILDQSLGQSLGESRSVLATRGNLNNDLGVPLTLLRLGHEHRYAVIEMGANHLGEIAVLTALARPSVAVLTNAGPAHLEGFGDLDAVARAKGELFQGLSEGSTAVINADDPFCQFWRGLARGHRVLTFGLTNPADITGANLDLSPEGTRFQLNTPAGGCEVVLGLIGRHNVMNALAVGAAAFALGVPLEALCRGLAHTVAVKGRLQLRCGAHGARLIDDTYNANPASLLSGMRALAAFPGERVLVLGDMAELGEGAERWHAEMGARAREFGINRLFATGVLGAIAAQSFGAGSAHFSDHEALIGALQGQLHSGMTLLVKGSRCMRMEQVVAALSPEDSPGDGPKDHYIRPQAANGT
jgi:UDP-N-acetylmuramoyl-tripeptide--D-alanyl-D-alanine ligase